MISYIDIIFLMIVAVVLVSRLYSVLGTRGEEKGVRIVVKPLPENLENQPVKKAVYEVKEEQENIVDINSLSEVNNKIQALPDFDKEHFINGARRVFELVVQAFGKADLAPIYGLVSKKVFNAFTEVLSFREENKISAEVDFICFDKAEIKDIKRLKNSIRVIVEFVSEQINLLRNAEGEVIEGDENFVQKITDIWTFERDLNAKNYEWVLVSTKKNV